VVKVDPHSPKAIRELRRVMIARSIAKERAKRVAVVLLVPAQHVQHMRSNVRHDEYYFRRLGAGQEVAPATVHFGGRFPETHPGDWQLGDGNHRTSAAKELRVDLPVRFIMRRSHSDAWVAARLAEGYRLHTERGNQ
jgi:hypothetical protein